MCRSILSDTFPFQTPCVELHSHFSTEGRDRTPWKLAYTANWSVDFTVRWNQNGKSTVKMTLLLLCRTASSLPYGRNTWELSVDKQSKQSGNGFAPTWPVSGDFSKKLSNTCSPVLLAVSSSQLFIAIVSTTRFSDSDNIVPRSAQRMKQSCGRSQQRLHYGLDAILRNPQTHMKALAAPAGV